MLSPFEIGVVASIDHFPAAEPGEGRIANERPPSPSSASVARLYSTPSGRLTTSVSGKPVFASPLESRSSAVTKTVSPER